MYAILVKGKVVPTNDMNLWSAWFHNAERVVKDKIGDAVVSTCFLGIDHGFGGEPLWFETMIFGGEYDGWSDRYTTVEQAYTGHNAAVRMVQGKLPEDEVPQLPAFLFGEDTGE